ncbi:MAG: sigma-70 family RNA polymerase sigma factor [Chitinophagaceae bacterium]|nr:sigma-70 family RNA polymerase sigma factor [Chitinophagaceae bacterium]
MEINDHTGKPDVERLVKEHQSRLRSFIGKRVSNKEDAEDILQDVFYQLIKTVESNISPIEQVAAWLYRVARNTIINKSRKKREEEWPVPRYDDEGNALEAFSEILFSDDSPGAETEYMRSLVWKELEAALSELPPEQREAFELTELEGLPVKEVAKTINAPVNTLLSRKHYAVKHLRKRLYDLYNDLMNYG